MTEPAIHELAKEIAVLEEKMNTKQQEYKTDIAQLRTDSERREGETRAAIERLRTDMAGRDTYMVRTIYAAIGIALGLLGFLIAVNVQ